MTFISKPNKLLRALLLSSVLLSQSCNIEPFPDTSSQELNQDNAMENQLRPLQDDEFRVFDKIQKTPLGLYRWEAQLNKIIENNSFYIGNDLKLMDYEFIGDVVSSSDLEVIKSKLVANFDVIPVEKSNRVGEYELRNNALSIMNYEAFLDMMFPTSDRMLRIVGDKKKNESNKIYEFYEFKKLDLSTIELKWDYKGEKLKTLCLISKEKGIIYDPFLYFINYSPRRETRQFAIISSPSSRLLSFGGEIGVVVKKVRYSNQHNDNAYGALGDLHWSYFIEYEASGEETNGTKSMDNKYTYARYRSNFFWDCTASCTQLSFETGTSGHLDVAWGWANSFGGTASLTYNGLGFSVSSGDNGETGSEYIPVDQLHIGF